MEYFSHPLSLILAANAVHWFCTVFRMTMALSVNDYLDLSAFGECVIHFTKMKDDWETIDRTEAIIHAQYQSREAHQHQMISVYNSSFDKKDPVRSLIQPDVSVKEECALNVLLGVHFNQQPTVIEIILTSNYTYSSDPFSTYIFVLDSELKYAHSDRWKDIPTRIFYLGFPDPSSISHKNPPHLWYICFQCARSVYAKMYITPNLASVSSLNLRSNWAKQDIVFKRLFVTSRFILYLGQYWAFKKPSMSYCEYGFMDLLSKSAEPNMTIIVQPLYTGHNYQSGYTGNIQIDVSYVSFTFRRATSSWYEYLTKGHILYCTCRTKTQRAFIYEGWIGSFKPDVWLGILISILSLSAAVAFKSSKIKKPNVMFAVLTKTNFCVSLFDVCSLFLRQGGLRNNVLMLLGTFIAGIVSGFYENFITSAIIAPETSHHHTLQSLMDAGYTVLYKTFTTENFKIQTIENYLMDAGVAYNRKQIQLANASTFDSLKAVDENNNYLSYFDWFSDLARKSWLSRIQLYNKDCNCLTLEHGFHEIPGYTEINHFLSSRFHTTLNRLRGNGLYNFYRTTCRITADNLAKTRLKRMLDAEEFTRLNKSGSSPEIEFGSTDYIGSSNLNVIFCLLGVLCLTCLLIFSLVELEAFIVCVRCVKAVLSGRNITKFCYKVCLDMLALVRYLSR
jgi:hypothetical protein